MIWLVVALVVVAYVWHRHVARRLKEVKRRMPAIYEGLRADLSDHLRNGTPFEPNQQQMALINLCFIASDGTLPPQMQPQILKEAAKLADDPFPVWEALGNARKAQLELAVIALTWPAPARLWLKRFLGRKLRDQLGVLEALVAKPQINVIPSRTTVLKKLVGGAGAPGAGSKPVNTKPAKPEVVERISLHQGQLLRWLETAAPRDPELWHLLPGLNWRATPEIYEVLIWVTARPECDEATAFDILIAGQIEDLYEHGYPPANAGDRLACALMGQILERLDRRDLANRGLALNETDAEDLVETYHRLRATRERLIAAGKTPPPWPIPTRLLEAEPGTRRQPRGFGGDDTDVLVYVA